MNNTALLLVIAISVFSLIAMYTPGANERLMHVPYLVNRRGQYYRWLTSGFVHEGLGHLFFNMFTMLFMGSALLDQLYFKTGDKGDYALIGIFLAGVVLSDLPNYFKYKDSTHYASLGASGGVSAIVFAGILYMPVNELCLYGFLCLPGFIWGVLYLAYSFYQARQGSTGINDSAHFYGALVGIVMASLIDLQSPVTFVQTILAWISKFSTGG